MKIDQRYAGNMTNMVVMPIYSKHFKNLLSKSHCDDCIKHQRPKHFIFGSNFDTWLTTYFMARSNFAT